MLQRPAAGRRWRLPADPALPALVTDHSEAMLPPNLVMDGPTHLCESAGEIFCFSLGESMM